MGFVVDLRTKRPGAKTLVLQIEFEVMVVEQHSSAE